MYKVVFYGLMASPPTKAHQAILKQLLVAYPQKKYIINYSPDLENKKTWCTVQNDTHEIVFSGTLESLGFSVTRHDLDRLIKIKLAKAGYLDYTEVCCVPSADGPPVLGKSPSAQNHHRYEMLKIAAAEVDETGVIVSDIEIALSELIELPSYTANTLIVLREGLIGLLDHPDNLLSVDERKRGAAEKRVLLEKRIAAIHHYLEHPNNPWLTPHGLMDDVLNKDELNITLVMGLDSFNSLERWFDASCIASHSNEIAIVGRADSNRALLDACLGTVAQPVVFSSFFESLKMARKVSVLSLDTLLGVEDISTYSSTGVRDEIVLNEIMAGCLAGSHFSPNSARLNWVSPAILAYIQAQRLYQPCVSAITDSEGDLAHFNQSLSMADDLIERLKSKRLAHNLSSVRVFLGDVCDKGPQDLHLLHDIKHRVSDRQLKEKWLLIAGNRDDNKIRILELLNEDYIRGFIKNPGPYWNESTTSPTAFCRSFDVDYSSLDINNQRVIVLKWMLDKTMGAPNAFEYRHQELQILLKKSPEQITDVMVMQSFIEEIVKPSDYPLLSGFDGFQEQVWVLPEAYRGVMRWYIENSQSMAIIGKTFYSHAGLPEGVYPYLQSGERLLLNATQTSLYQWIEARNDERHRNIQTYIQDMLTKRQTGISAHLAIQASLSKRMYCEGADNARAYNIQSFDSFKDPYDSSTLQACGIKTSIHGHQIALTATPRMTRLESLVIANVDTRLSNGTLIANGTVIAFDKVYCLSQLHDKTYFISDSTDLRIGRTLNIKDEVTDEPHPYTVVAQRVEPKVSDSRYLLVCYERKGLSPFFSVDPSYGVRLLEAKQFLPGYLK